jgi:hypothetical protein
MEYDCMEVEGAEMALKKSKHWVVVMERDSEQFALEWPELDEAVV